MLIQEQKNGAEEELGLSYSVK